MSPPGPLDFQHLKAHVTIEQVLAHRSLLGRLTRRGHRLMGACPIHGGDNPTAFVVDCRRGLWHCFTGCSRGGDIVELVRQLDHCGYRQAAEALAELIGREPRPTTHRHPPPAPGAVFRPFRRRLSLDSAHPFLATRRIRPATAARFEVGAWHGAGMLHECIAVRLHGPRAEPLGYAGRRLSPHPRGKWVFPPRLPKSQLLYGLHHVDPRGPLTLVEGPWDVLRLSQLQIPAVALLGTTLSADQAELIRHAARIVVMLDGDPVGRRAARRISTDLGADLVLLDHGHDPTDLTDAALRAHLPS